MCMTIHQKLLRIVWRSFWRRYGYNKIKRERIQNKCSFCSVLFFILMLYCTKKNASEIMTQAYWNVGKRIVEQELLGQERDKYGSYLIKNLSRELSDEFGTGFSIASLKNCR